MAVGSGIYQPSTGVNADSFVVDMSTVNRPSTASINHRHPGHHQSHGDRVDAQQSASEKYPRSLNLENFEEYRDRDKTGRSFDYC